MLTWANRVYLFKAKAMAEKKKLQAQGLKAGDDFVDGKFFDPAVNKKQ